MLDFKVHVITHLASRPNPSPIAHAAIAKHIAQITMSPMLDFICAPVVAEIAE